MALRAATFSRTTTARDGTPSAEPSHDAVMGIVAASKLRRLALADAVEDYALPTALTTSGCFPGCHRHHRLAPERNGRRVE